MFSERLRLVRKKSGVSQYTLADDMNVKQSTVSGWENGNREPDFATINRLSEYFNVSIDYLLGKSNIKKMPTLSKEDEQNMHELIALYDAAPPELQAAALAVLESAEAAKIKRNSLKKDK